MTFAALIPRVRLARRAAALRRRALSPVRRDWRWRRARRSTTSIRSAPRSIRWSIEPDVPASKVYDQGLAQTGQWRAAGRGEEIHRSRQAISRFGLGAQRPADDDLRAVSGRRLRQRRAVGRALREAISEVARGRLRALSRGEHLLQANTRHLARPGARRQGVGAVPEGREELSRIPNTSRTPSSRSR